jgi:hypothetical protein
MVGTDILKSAQEEEKRRRGEEEKRREISQGIGERERWGD